MSRRTCSIWPSCGVALVAALAVAALNRVALAQWPTANAITERTFLEACDELALSEPQEKAALAAYRRYAEAVGEAWEERNRLVNEIEEKLGLRQFIDWDREEFPIYIEWREARRRAFTPDKVNERNRAVQETGRAARLQEEHLRRQMVNELANLLSEPQVECLPIIERFLRRRMIADVEWPAEMVRQNLMDFVGLRDLLHEATSSGAEFELLKVPPMCGFAGALGEAEHSLEHEIAIVLHHFEHVLDAHLLYAPEQLRQIDVRSGRARRDGNDTAVHRYEKHRAQLMMRPYLLKRDSARTIGVLARSELGDNAADAWEERVARVMFPVLFQIESPDRMHEWLTDSVDLDDDQRAALDPMYEDYLRQRRALRSQAMQIELDIMLEGSHPAFRTHPTRRTLTERIGRLHEQHEELLAKRRSLADTTNQRFRSILDSEAKSRFDEHLKGVRVQREFASHEAPP